MQCQERTSSPEVKAEKFECTEKMFLSQVSRTPPTISNVSSYRPPKISFVQTFKNQVQRRAIFTSVTGPKDLGHKHFSEKFKNTRHKHLATYTSGFRVEKEKSILPSIEKQRGIVTDDEASMVVTQKQLGKTACTMKLDKKTSGDSIQQRNDHVKEIVNAYRRPQKKPVPEDSTVNKKVKQANIQALQSNLRIQINNMSANANEIVEYFNRKCGLKQAPVFIFNSQDEYIRRILLYWGWSQNRIIDSPFFNLKWSYKDLNTDYSRLVPGQLLNHFKNNQQLTSKGRLLVNIRNNEYSTSLSHETYFPRCFDLGNPNDIEEFNLEYENTTVFIILRKTYNYIKLRLPKHQFDEIDRKIADRHQRRLKGFYVRKNKSNSMEGKLFHKIDSRFSLMRFENFKNRREDFLLHINLCILSLKYLRHLKKSHQIDHQQKCNHILNFKKGEFKSNFCQILKYSTMNPPYKPSKEIEFTKEYYATPSKLTIEKFISYHNYFSQRYGKIWNAEGLQNIWVIKPANNSRGNGIYLHKDRNEITSSSEGLGSSIVQKYIEQPLIISNPIYPQISSRKFDIRQWVLVTSYLPLKIYRFSECYLRICSESYDLSQIKALQKHLTNYSFNKNNFSNKSQSVISLQNFRQILSKQHSISWETHLVPRINDIIVDVIQRCSENIQQSSQCFQLYGFDILIDSGFNPWLLEVNLSPACQQRCDFLKDYCQVMGEKLLKFILPADLQPKNIPPLNDNYDKYDWIKILKQDAYFEDKKRQVDLQIIGSGANLRKQKIIDKKYYENEAALRIQTLYKMVKAKRILKLLKTKLHSGTLNKYIHSLKEVIKTRKIQYKENVNILKKYLLPKIEEFHSRSLWKVYFAQNYIEKFIKGLNEQNKYKKNRITQSVQLIKSMYLHLKQVNNIVQKKYLLSKMKIIQRFYKKRYTKLNVAAKLIQKYMRAYCFERKRIKFHKDLAKLHNKTVLSYYMRSFIDTIKINRLLKNRSEKTVKLYLKGFHVKMLLCAKKYNIFTSKITSVVNSISSQHKFQSLTIVKKYSYLKQAATETVSPYFHYLTVLKSFKSKQNRYFSKKISTYLRGVSIQNRFIDILYNKRIQWEQERASKIVSAEVLSDIQELIRQRIETSRKLSIEQSSNLPERIETTLPPINSSFNKYMHFIAKSNSYLQRRQIKKEENSRMKRKKD